MQVLDCLEHVRYSWVTDVHRGFSVFVLVAYNCNWKMIVAILHVAVVIFAVTAVYFLFAWDGWEADLVDYFYVDV